MASVLQIVKSVIHQFSKNDTFVVIQQNINYHNFMPLLLRCG